MLDGRKLLIYLSIINDGDWEKIYCDIVNKRNDFDLEQVEKEIAKVKSKIVTMLDSDYPESLNNIWRTPFVLYYYGDISLASNYMKNIAVVGSRKYSTYGSNITKILVRDISKNFIIVSGLARGIDSIAHETAIESGGKTIAILGSGIENCYPTDNINIYKKIKKEHLLISEYPNNSEPDASHFPLRNRIIAALACSVLVTEASQQSGTSITVGHALSIGRSVCCVPHQAGHDSLCNKLISEGARLVENAEDIYDELNFKEEN